jgi:membrane fusion protein, multidrug efflux system
MERQDMQRGIRAVDICVAVAALAAIACGTKAETRPGVDAAPVGRPPVAVAVTPAAVRDLTDTVDVVGSLAPKFFADVKSEVTGVITAVYVTEWTPVRAGAPLARLDASEAEAAIAALKAVTAQAGVAERRARRENDRARQLLEYGLITSQAADEAQSALDAAAAGAVAAQAQVQTAEARLAKYFIKAPMDGVVALRRANVGDRVENMGGGDPMFRVVDTRLLELTVTVPSARVSAVRVGQALEFTTDALPNRPFTGHVMFINPAVDEASRSARVVAEVGNSDGALKGGLFVRGQIVLATRPGAILVPREALIDWNVAARTASLFVVADECAEKRPVRIGVVAADGVEIVAGLAAGEPVVTRGAFALHTGDPIAASAPPASGR